MSPQWRSHTHPTRDSHSLVLLPTKFKRQDMGKCPLWMTTVTGQVHIRENIFFIFPHPTPFRPLKVKFSISKGDNLFNQEIQFLIITQVHRDKSCNPMHASLNHTELSINRRFCQWEFSGIYRYDITTLGYWFLFFLISTCKLGILSPQNTFDT